MSSIDVPVPQYKKALTSNDHPTPVLQIKYTGSPPYGEYRPNSSTITLYYPHSLTLNPLETITISFPILIETSLPCLTIIYGSQILFRHGLTCNITISHSNEPLIHPTRLYNFTDKLLTFPPHSLTFNCLTVIATI